MARAKWEVYGLQHAWQAVGIGGIVESGSVWVEEAGSRDEPWMAFCSGTDEACDQLSHVVRRGQQTPVTYATKVEAMSRAEDHIVHHVQGDTK